MINTQHREPQAAPGSAAQSRLADAYAVIQARRAWLAPGLLLLAVGIFALTTLRNFPTVFVDEGSNANRAWSFLQTGHAFASVDSGVYQQFDGYWTYFPYLAVLPHALFLWAFGLSPESLRLASVFFGLILLLTVYIISYQLYGRRTALISMALLATSAPFVYSSHLGRHDIIVTTLGFGAVALYLLDRGSSLSLKSVLSGLAIGFALDIHLNGLIFGPVMLSFYILDYGKTVFRTGRFWGFVAGGLLGTLFFVSMHIIPYPDTYFAIAGLGNGTLRTPPIFTLSPALWQWSLLSTGAMIDLLLVPVMVPALIFLIRRQSRADVKIYALLGMLVLAATAFIAHKTPYYAILVAPAVSLILAPYLGHITQKIGKVGEWVLWRNILVLSAIVAASLISMAPAVRGSDDEFQKVLSYLRETIPNGSVVYGSTNYWFALPETPYVNWEQLLFLQRYKPGSTFTDAVEEVKPDYLVVDSFMNLLVKDDENCHDNYMNTHCIPKVELETFLKEQATLAGQIETEDYGHIQIYKMDWASKSSNINEKGKASR